MFDGNTTSSDDDEDGGEREESEEEAARKMETALAQAFMAAGGSNVGRKGRKGQRKTRMGERGGRRGEKAKKMHGWDTQSYSERLEKKKLQPCAQLTASYLQEPVLPR